MKVASYSDKFAAEVKDFILKILEGEFGHVNVNRPDLDNIPKFYQTENGNFWVAIQDGEVVGTIGLKDYQGTGYIKRMAVKKELRGTGIAQKLLQTCLDYSRDHGFEKLFLSTSANLKAANRFYSKMGFKRITSLPEAVPPQIAVMHYEIEL